MKFSENIHRLDKNKIFPIWPHLLNFCFVAAEKWQQLKSGILIIQSTSYVLYKLANWVIRNDLNWATFAKFRPSGDWKMAPILMWSDQYLDYWSLDPLHTWCTHWLCKFSEMSRYLATLTSFCPLVAKKWQQSEAFESHLEYWSLNILHTG